MVLVGLLSMARLPAMAQNQTVGSAAALASVARSDFDVCQEALPNVLRLTNNGAGMMAPVSLTLLLSPGAVYEPGSVSLLNGSGSISETNLSDLRNPVFSLPGIAQAGSLNIGYRQRFGCEVIAFRDAGNLILDNARLSYTIGGTNYVQSLTNNGSSNVRSAVLSVLGVSNAAYVGNVGDTFVQSVTMTNGGLGYLTSASLNLGTLGGVTVSGPSVGTLVSSGSGPATTASIDLPPSAFGADGQWTNGETVVVSYSVTVTNCEYLQRGLTVSWGCAGGPAEAAQTCQTSSPPFPVGVLVSNSVPNIEVAVLSPAPSTCQLDAPTSVTALFTNTGTGPATNLTGLDLFQSAAGMPINYAYSFAIQPQSVQLTLPNGSASPASTSVVQTITAHAALGNGTSGCFAGGAQWVRVGVPAGTLLLPGQRLTVVFTLTACQNTVCDASFSAGMIAARLSYASQCQSATFTTPVTERLVSPALYVNGVTLQAPAQINNGETFEVAMGATMVTNVSSPSDYVDFSLTLPTGFSYVAGSLIETASGLTVASGYPKVQNGQLVIRYMHLPPRLDVAVAPRLRLLVNQAVCVGGNFALNADVRYYPNSTCTRPMYARGCQSGTVVVGCSVCTEGGLAVQSFSFRRVTLGLPDNNQDGRPDANGAVNESLAQLNRYRPGDVMQASSRGVIVVGQTVQSWPYVYAEWTFGQGVWLPDGNASVTIKRSGGPDAFSVTCPDVPVRAIVANRQYKIDWSALSNCLPTGYAYQPGDSVLIDARFRLTTTLQSISGDDIGTTLSSMSPTNGVVTQAFYATQVANAPTNPGGGQGGPNRWQCGIVNYNYYMLGLLSYFGFNGARAFNGSCTPLNTSVTLYNAVLNRTSGSQYFPYEFRPVAIPDEVSLRLPAGYALLPGQNNVAVSTYTTKANSVSTLSSAVNPVVTGTVQTGLTLTWNLRQLIAANQVFIGTEGYNLTIPFQLMPTCQAQDNAPTYPTYLGRWSDFPNGNQPQSFSVARHNAVLLTYTPTLKPALKMATPLPNILTTTSTVSWSVALQNPTANAAPHSFIRFRTKGQYTDFVVTDMASGTVVPALANGLYPLGTIEGAATRNYRITATLGQCAADSLVLDYGWDCGGYPTDFSAYPCGQSVTLSAQGNPAGLDATFNFIPSEPDGTVWLCQPVSFTTTLNSTQVGALKDILYTVELPEDMDYVPNSLSYVFPTTGGATNSPYNPVQVGRQLRFQLTRVAPTTPLSAGLSGVADNEHRTVQLLFQGMARCGFLAGTLVRAGYSGTAVCGDVLPSLAQVSSPLLVSGATATSQFRLQADLPALLACGPTQTVSVSATQTGTAPTGLGEKFIVTLPPTVQYVAGSALPASVTVSTAGANTTLCFPVPAGVGNGQSFVTTFGVQSSSTLCQEQSTLDFKTYQTVSVNCNGSTCSTPVRSGALLQVPIDIRKAQLSFSAATLSLTALSAAQEAASLTLVVSNAASTTANPTTTLLEPAAIDLISDRNGNGVFDTGEPVVATTWAAAGLAPGTSATVTTSFTLPTGHCGFVVRINPTLNTCNCPVAERAVPVRAYDTGVLPTTLCTGQYAEIGGVAVTGYRYAWSGIEGSSISALSSLTAANPLFSTNLPGHYAYQLQVSRAGGCPPLAQTVALTVEAPPSLTVVSSAVCTGQPGSLTVLGCTGRVQWSTGATSPVLTVGAVETTRFYSVSCTSGPCSATAQGFITAHPAVTATIGGNTSLCAGSLATLTAGGGSRFRWSTGATTQVILVSSAGVYSVTATGEGGCFDVASVTVVVNATPVLGGPPTVVGATCTGAIPNNDALIRLTNLQFAERADLVAGSTYVGGPAYNSTGNTRPTNGGTTLNFGGLPNPAQPTAYTVRLFGPGGRCFTDVVVTLTPTVCICPPDRCVPFLVRAKR